jgi:hypothetical protein
MLLVSNLFSQCVTNQPVAVYSFNTENSPIFLPFPTNIPALYPCGTFFPYPIFGNSSYNNYTGSFVEKIYVSSGYGYDSVTFWLHIYPGDLAASGFDPNRDTIIANAMVVNGPSFQTPITGNWLGYQAVWSWEIPATMQMYNPSNIPWYRWYRPSNGLNFYSDNNGDVYDTYLVGAMPAPQSNSRVCRVDFIDYPGYLQLLRGFTVTVQIQLLIRNQATGITHSYMDYPTPITIL